MTSGRCFYCDEPVFPPGSPQVLHDSMCLATRDHWIPFSITADADLNVSRIVTACAWCNQTKGDGSPEIWAWFVRNAVSTTRKDKGAEWRRFRYLLMEAGFRAAASAIRPQVAAPPVEAAPTPPPMPRDNRGRYTKRDLMRGRAA